MDHMNKYAEVNVMQHDAPHGMPLVETPAHSPAPRTVTRYVAIWAGLAVVALAYISVALARPDILGVGPTEMVRTAEDKSSNRPSMATDSALEQKLARMEQDLNASQGETGTSTVNKQSHLDRIAALDAKAARAEAAAEAKTQGTAPLQEPAMMPPTATTIPGETTAADASKKAAEEIADRLAGTKILNTKDGANAAAKNSTTLVKQTAKAVAKETAAAAVTEAATPKAPQVAEITKSAIAPVTKTVTAKPVAKKAPIKVAALPKATPAPKVATPKATAKKKSSNLKTGSVGKAATKPITFGPAVVTRATRPIGVRIATGPSVDSLRLSWNALADRHGAPLKRLQPRYVTGIGATGLTYDLIAGPFNTANEASQVCARLHANGARCALGEFTGNAL